MTAPAGPSQALPPTQVVGPPGFEPGTSPLSGARSDQLSYGPVSHQLALGETLVRAPYHGLALKRRSTVGLRPVSRRPSTPRGGEVTRHPGHLNAPARPALWGLAEIAASAGG